MKTPQYLEIIKNIKRDDVTDIDKGTAIMQMQNFATLNHVSKDELVEIIRYLFPIVYDWDGKECVPDTDVGEWRKYPEEKPEENNWYLTTNGEGLPKITYFDIDIWYQTGKFFEVEVTHWQPLPELPKEE